MGFTSCFILIFFYIVLCNLDFFTLAAVTSMDDDKRVPDTNQIRNNASKWTLADDVGLLSHLQLFSEGIIQQSVSTEQSLRNLTGNVEEACTNFSNVSNQLLSLQNSQFLESRVYDDETPTEENKNAIEVKEDEKPLSNLESYKEAVAVGMQLLDSHFHQLEYVESSDSDEDLSSSEPAMVWRPKPKYLTPLPLLIGSAEWWADDSVGLAEFRENEDVVSSDVESLDAPQPADAQTNRVRLSSSSSCDDVPTLPLDLTADSILHDDDSPDDVKRQGSIQKSAVIEGHLDFTRELASKLGTVVNKIPTSKINSESDEVDTEHKPSVPSLTRPSTEPRRAENSTPQISADIKSYVSDNDLFGSAEDSSNDLFRPVRSENLFDDFIGETDDIFSSPRSIEDNAKMLSKEFLSKKAISVKNAEKSIDGSKAIIESRKPDLSSGDLFDDVDNDDLFGSVQKKSMISKPPGKGYENKEEKHPTNKDAAISPVKTAKSNPSIDLFSDLTSNDEDLFSSKPINFGKTLAREDKGSSVASTKVPDPNISRIDSKNENAKSAIRAEGIEKTENNTISTDLFSDVSGDVDLFSEIEPTPSKSSGLFSKDVSEKKTLNVDLFGENLDDDLFAPKEKKAMKPFDGSSSDKRQPQDRLETSKRIDSSIATSRVPVQPDTAPSNDRNRGLFDDLAENDLFSSKVTSHLEKSKSTSIDLFAESSGSGKKLMEDNVLVKPRTMERAAISVKPAKNNTFVGNDDLFSAPSIDYNIVPNFSQKDEQADGSLTEKLEASPRLSSEEQICIPDDLLAEGVPNSDVKPTVEKIFVPTATKSIFLDDEDDNSLFSNPPTNVSMSSSHSSLFDDSNTNKSTLPGIFAKTGGISKGTLFENVADDYDLFSPKILSSSKEKVEADKSLKGTEDLFSSKKNDDIFPTTDPLFTKTSTNPPKDVNASVVEVDTDLFSSNEKGTSGIEKNNTSSSEGSTVIANTFVGSSPLSGSSLFEVKPGSQLSDNVGTSSPVEEVHKRKDNVGDISGEADDGLFSSNESQSSLIGKHNTSSSERLGAIDNVFGDSYPLDASSPTEAKPGNRSSDNVDIAPPIAEIHKHKGKDSDIFGEVDDLFSTNQKQSSTLIANALTEASPLDSGSLFEVKPRKRLSADVETFPSTRETHKQTNQLSNILAEADDDLFSSNQKQSSQIEKNATASSGRDIFGDESPLESDSLFGAKPQNRSSSNVDTIPSIGGIHQHADKVDGELKVSSKISAKIENLFSNTAVSTDFPKVNQERRSLSSELSPTSQKLFSNESVSNQKTAKSPEKSGEVGKIGKLNIPSSLRINPAALLPGAKLSKSNSTEIKEENIPEPQIAGPSTSVIISRDQLDHAGKLKSRQDVQVPTLQHLGRDRAKIVAKRRPQSRHARQLALQSESAEEDKEAKIESSSPSRKVKPESNDFDVQEQHSAPALSKESAITNIKSKSSFDKNIPSVGNVPTKPSQILQNKSVSNDLFSDDIEESSNLFSSKKLDVKLATKTSKSLFGDEDDDDDLFGKPIVVSSPLKIKDEKKTVPVLPKPSRNNRKNIKEATENSSISSTDAKPFSDPLGLMTEDI